MDDLESFVKKLEKAKVGAPNGFTQRVMNRIEVIAPQAELLPGKPVPGKWIKQVMHVPTIDECSLFCFAMGFFSIVLGMILSILFIKAQVQALLTHAGIVPVLSFFAAALLAAIGALIRRRGEGILKIAERILLVFALCISLSVFFMPMNIAVPGVWVAAGLFATIGILVVLFLETARLNVRVRLSDFSKEMTNASQKGIYSD